MEDTLRVEPVEDDMSDPYYVLILILMEDTLRVHERFSCVICLVVLILILMEDTLREYNTKS